MAEISTINLAEKFGKFSDHWHPRLIAELNGQQVKLAKLKGEFVWHSHADEDELFFIVKGTLFIELRDKTLELNAGEMAVIPRGVEHRPYAPEEVEVMLFEPAQTKHTGDVRTELTRDTIEKI